MGPPGRSQVKVQLIMPSSSMVRATGSVGIAVGVALLQIILSPRNYNYPKLLAYGLARRVRRWRMGRAENRFGAMAQRLLYLLRMTVLHGRIVRKRNLYGGLMHACLFGGFITLLAGTTIVMIQADIAVPVFGVNFLQGDFYLGFKLAMNLGGLLLLTGIALALYRRMVLKPATQESSADDGLILVWLAVLVVQGYALQALRLALTLDPWAVWSFVSYPLSGGFKSWSLLTPGAARKLIACEQAVERILGRQAAFRMMMVIEKRASAS